MEKINVAVGFISTLLMLPIYGLAIALIVLGIMGLIKKNFVTFKKVLKIEGYFVLVLVIVFAIQAISIFVSNL